MRTAPGPDGARRDLVRAARHAAANGPQTSPGLLSTLVTRDVSRRDALRGAAVLTLAAALTVGPSTGQARAIAVGFDPQQRFLQFAGGGDGQIFAVQADGSLLWYRHLGWASASGGWAPGSGRPIGSGWHEYQTVMGSVDGSLYALRADGTLWYQRYTLRNDRTGEGHWTDARQIGSGFNRYARVFGFNGAVYGVTGSGDLYWHQFTPRTGTWAVHGKQLIGNYKTSTLYADTDGVLYAYRNGAVTWHRHSPGGQWSRGSGRVIAFGFEELAIHGLHFLGEGTLYVVRPTLPTKAVAGELIAFRITNHTTAGGRAGASWANRRSGRQVAGGWTVEPQAALQGYALTRSLSQGETLQVAVSSTFPTYSYSVVRVGSGPQPAAVSGPVAAKGAVQRLPVGFVTAGCGWQPQLSIPIPLDWAPGLYAVRLEGPHGLHRYVPFIVKPAVIENRIAVLLPTNTYAAYNTWGGHSQYCHDLKGVRQLSQLRPSTQHAVEATGLIDHTLWSDILLLQWLNGQGLDADCYADPDLHTSGDWLAKYDVLVLGSHPEYWTDQARQHVVDFVAGGGRLIYSGGNGIYARVSYDESLDTILSGRPDGTREVFSELGRPTSQLLGVNYREAGYGTFAPYVVTADHPIFDGTGLTRGSLFGAQGYNGGASGWEMDGFLGLPGEAGTSHVVAKGTNAPSGAQMVLRDTSAGGFVFSASSIAFNGAVGNDPAMSKLFRNVFDRALAVPAPSPTAAPQPTVAPAAAQPEPTPGA